MEYNLPDYLILDFDLVLLSLPDRVNWTSSRNGKLHDYWTLPAQLCHVTVIGRSVY